MDERTDIIKVQSQDRNAVCLNAVDLTILNDWHSNALYVHVLSI